MRQFGVSISIRTIPTSLITCPNGRSPAYNYGTSGGITDSASQIVSLIALAGERSQGTGRPVPWLRFAFSLLSSTDSAAVGGPALFARFSGTTRLSDFPATCMSALWHLAFSDRSISKERDGEPESTTGSVAGSKCL